MAPFAANRKSMRLVHAVDPLVVHAEPISAEQYRQPLVAKPRALGCVLQEAVFKTRDLSLLTSMPLSGSMLPRKSASLSLTELVLLLDELDRGSLGCGAYHFFATTVFSA